MFYSLIRELSVSDKVILHKIWTHAHQKGAPFGHMEMCWTALGWSKFCGQVHISWHDWPISSNKTHWRKICDLQHQNIGIYLTIRNNVVSNKIEVFFLQQNLFFSLITGSAQPRAVQHISMWQKGAPFWWACVLVMTMISVNLLLNLTGIIFNHFMVWFIFELFPFVHVKINI
jgi:hypothetical protein